MLKFATSKEQDGTLLERPARCRCATDLRPTYPDYFAENPDYKTFADQAARTVEVPNVPNSIEIWQTFRDAYSQVGDLRQGRPWTPPCRRRRDKVDELAGAVLTDARS